jgi:Zn-dependent M28 family amino/carboxypeptidase
MKPYWAAVLVICLTVVNCVSKQGPTFSGERAYFYLKAQCDFGPRVPGSEGHQEALRYLKTELTRSTTLVRLQGFSAVNPISQQQVELTNLQATFYPELEERILLCAHWDSRPWADQDSDSDKRNTPILGANDGASGVAVLLHLAEMISKKKPKYGVDIVLFDGEDMGKGGYPETYALGSQYFAQNLANYLPRMAILLDMVGDTGLKIYQEQYSVQHAPETVRQIWERARSLKLDCFIDTVGYAVWDDHLPLLQRGIPCASLIDFEYPYWHTTQDRPDKCSAESLEKIGRLLVSILYD